MAPNIASWCDTCFCFRDTRRAITAIGMFTLSTSMVMILTAVAVFVGFNEKEALQLNPAGSKESITYILYIILAIMCALNVIFSVWLLYGNERTNELRARMYYMPWLILQPFIVLYEAGINIYYFYNQFNNLYEEPLKYGHYTALVIVPLVFWIIKTMLAFICFIFMIVRVQMLKEDEGMQYVQQGGQGGCGGVGCGGCYDCSVGPTMHAPIALPPPALPACTSCSGGACGGNRCGKCNKAQPLYGYAGAQSRPMANTTTGWATSFYSR